MRSNDLAPRQQSSQVPCDQRLSRMGTDFLNPRIKRLQRSKQSFNAQCGGDIRRIDNGSGNQECSGEHRKRDLYAVDEGQSLLRLKLNRLETFFLQGALAGYPLAINERLALSYQYLSQVGKWCEITTGCLLN